MLACMSIFRSQSSSQWRHNGCDGVSNHRCPNCLLSRLFGRISKKHQSSAWLVSVRGIHRLPVNSPHKGPVTRKMFPFDGVIMFFLDVVIYLRTILGAGSVNSLAPERHDDVIKWKHFQRYWPFVRGIHRSPVNSPHKGQWRGALVFSLICVWINGWVNNREAGDLRRYHAHYVIIVMI